METRQKRVQCRIVRLRHGLHARSAVDMGDRWKQVGLAYRCDKLHERFVAILIGLHPSLWIDEGVERELRK